MTEDEINALAQALFDAISAGDVDAARATYAPDAQIWHNFDRVVQTREQNMATLSWMVAKMQNRRYEDIRRITLPDGFVQQHVLRGDAAGGPVELEAMVRVWCADGVITRIEEYLDPAQVAPMRG